jgi:hypothetical protein
LLGDKMLAELERRDGVTPLAECSEFMDAFRSKAGEAERVDGTVEAEALRRGLRMALPGRGEMGDLSATGLSGLGAAGREAGGVPVGPMVKRSRDFARPPSPSSCLLLSECAG